MSARVWERRGDEAEGDDWRAGHHGPISREDLSSALAAHHDEDLVALDAEPTHPDRVAAVEAMVDAYLAARGRRAPEGT